MRFSVIMPVYNVEKYLETAVTSVLSQTFSDFELILVEDASPDNCAALCDSLAEKDKRINVIHNTVNSGAGFSRNFGIQAAKGEFILFVDSDDTISPDTFECFSDYFRIGNRYGRVIFLRDYASYIKDSMVTELTDINRNLMFSIDVVPVPTDEAVKEVDKFFR